jgi:hypothetical protein
LTSFHSRVALFLVLCAAGVLALLGYIRLTHNPKTIAGRDTAGTLTSPADLAAVTSRAHLVFLNTTLDDRNNRVAIAPLDELTGSRLITGLRCERVHMAARVGLCLTADRGVLSRYYGYLFDETFAARAQFPLQGAPSRARVSPDGRLAAMTVFVSGDSYANGNFSTRTTLIDTGTGRAVGELEQFTALQDGKAFRAADFNYWGVTFARQPGIFFATLGTAGHLWLVRGDASRREVTVLRDGVECPSLSPDDTRVVFKKRETKNGRLGWRLSVLSLQTLNAVPLAEERSVDDQAEWLDGERVVYALPKPGGGTAIWTARADGSGTPQRLLDDAFSPAPVK